MAISLSAVVLALTAAISLSACETVRVLSFVKDKESGVETEQKTNLNFYEDCSNKESAIAGFAIDQILKLGKAAIDRRADEIRQNSQAVYSASVLILKRPAGPLEGCLVFTRESEVNPKVIGLEVRLKIENKEDVAFTIKPEQVTLKNSLAWTGASQPVDLSIAFSGITGISSNGGGSLVPIGETVFTVEKVEFGKTLREGALPPKSRLVAQPPAGKLLELTIAVTETGSAIPDSGKVKAETLALIEAAGPEIKKKLKIESD